MIGISRSHFIVHFPISKQLYNMFTMGIIRQKPKFSVEDVLGTKATHDMSNPRRRDAQTGMVRGDLALLKLPLPGSKRHKLVLIRQ